MVRFTRIACWCAVLSAAFAPRAVAGQSYTHFVAQAEAGHEWVARGGAFEIGGPRIHAAAELMLGSDGAIASASLLSFVTPERRLRPYLGLGIGVAAGGDSVFRIFPLRVGAELTLAPDLLAVRAEAREYVAPHAGHAAAFSIGARLF